MFYLSETETLKHEFFLQSLFPLRRRLKEGAGQLQEPLRLQTGPGQLQAPLRLETDPGCGTPSTTKTRD
jgi:hypothetical protein